MQELSVTNKDYVAFLNDIKRKIQTSRYKAQVAANSEMISLYWEIGKQIVVTQKQQGWGASVVKQLSLDLKIEHTGITGFSRTNLFSMRQFYLFFSLQSEKVPQAVGLLPWGHIRILLSKVKEIPAALFYAKEALENGWSRDIFSLQIEKQLYKRIGSAPTNFNKTLAQPTSDIAQQTIKDPYLFDFVAMRKKAHERDIEIQLIDHITKFLLELGKGFAFIGRQYPLTINGKDRFLDLLFYHTKLKCYVVIELKVGSFQPEYAGKLNYYLSAVDDLLCSSDDNPTIGIILCKDKNKMDVEYALRGLNKPIGVSSYIIDAIPKDLESSLPTIEQIEEKLAAINVIDKNKKQNYKGG